MLATVADWMVVLLSCTARSATVAAKKGAAGNEAKSVRVWPVATTVGSHLVRHDVNQAEGRPGIHTYKRNEAQPTRNRLGHVGEMGDEVSEPFSPLVHSRRCTIRMGEKKRADLSIVVRIGPK